MRRYSTDEAMAALQEICSSIEVRETEPKGEYYVVLNKANLTLSHIELYEGEKARPAVHRTKLAKINRKYEPDLFSELEDRSEENSLHVVLTIIKPGAKEETQVAPNILVSVPYSDFKGFHMQVELNDFFAYYTQKPDVIEIDMAWPSFREEILREEEKLRKNDSDG